MSSRLTNHLSLFTFHLSLFLRKLYDDKKKLSILLLIYLVSLYIPIQNTAYTDADAPAQLIARGEEFYTKGDIEHAIQSWEQAISVLEPEKDAFLHVLIYLTKAYQAIGHHQKALDARHKALPLVEKTTQTTLRTKFFNTFSDLHLSLGQVEKAKEYLEKAVKAARLTDDKRVLATISNNKGNLLETEAKYQASLTAYRECLEIIEQMTDLTSMQNFKSKTLINIVRVISRTGDDEKTAQAAAQAAAHIRKLPVSHAKAENLLSLGILISELKVQGSNLRIPSHQLLSESALIAGELQDSRILSYTSGYLGQLYEQERRYTEAMQLTRRAVFHAQQGNLSHIL